jgi:hypothetical protein
MVVYFRMQCEEREFWTFAFVALRRDDSDSSAGFGRDS